MKSRDDRQKLVQPCLCIELVYLLLSLFSCQVGQATMSPSAGSSSKRSRPTSTSAPAAAAEKPVKRIKPSRFHVASDSLKWKPVKTAPVAGFDEGGGMMMLEELDDVDVEWEEGMNGQKVAKFIVCLADLNPRDYHGASWLVSRD